MKSMRKKLKIKDIVANVIIALTMIVFITSNISLANNYADSNFNYTITGGGYGTKYSSIREKQDSSKVYFKNLTSSWSQVDLEVLGCNTSTGTFTNCNYNLLSYATDIIDAYQVPKDGKKHYWRSIVYETYHNTSNPNPYAKMQCSGVAGSYYTVWSPDNINGY